MTQTMTDEQTSVVTEQEIRTSNDKPNCAHIVLPPDEKSRESPQAYVMRARVEGFPVTALCGYTWVPNKMASGLPVCQECKDIYEAPGNRSDPDRSLPDE